MEDDNTVHEAVLFLYMKNPEISAIEQWNPITETFDHLFGTTRELGSESRIQVVGHGREENGNSYHML
jgi:hypothetical protein